MTEQPREAGSTTVKASPTKRFFVSMLTRDIELRDAVLDLLDNCIDGIMRTGHVLMDSQRPYSGKWARITIEENRFAIVDNCGGIPRDLAVNKAFMMGRREREKDEVVLPTVGMYGIGMKRAIFKMGRSSRVLSQTADDSFEVTISPEWLEDDLNWELPLRSVERSLAEPGTEIGVTDLHDDIRRRFAAGDRPFADEFATAVSQHYAFIMEKGFEVYVNGSRVPPKPLTLVHGRPGAGATEAIAPYVYRDVIDGVDVFLAVGFYRPAPDEGEIDAEQETRYSSDEAGWTVVCNDRVVVYRDRTRVTGWGEAGVPNYHNQFIAIAGVVHFISNDPWKLPLTTTKRGVDASSDIYLRVKERMREGTALFTRWTNRWKGDNAGRKAQFDVTEPIAVAELGKLDLTTIKSMSPGNIVSVRNEAGERFVPKLPEPRRDPHTARISFSKPIDDIRLVSDYLFEDPDRSPTEVGEACFDGFLRKAKQ